MIKRAGSLTVFIFLHCNTLVLMQQFTNMQDLVQLSITRLGVPLKRRCRWLVGFIDKVDGNIRSRTLKCRALKATIYSDSLSKRCTTVDEDQHFFKKLLRIVDADMSPKRILFMICFWMSNIDYRVRVACNMRNIIGSIIEITDSFNNLLFESLLLL